MVAFVIRRLIQTIVVLILVSFLAFSLLHVIPGDPAVAMLGVEATQQQIDALRHRLWLDRPLMVQYMHWFTNILQGDLGTSVVFSESISVLIATRLPITFYLGLIALVLSTLIGIPAGAMSAVRRGSLLDSFITLSTNIGMAVPLFWLGILGVYLFALKAASCCNNFLFTSSITSDRVFFT